MEHELQVLEMKRQLAQLNLELAQKKQVLEASNQEASKPKLPLNTYKEAIAHEAQPQYTGNLISLGNKPKASLKAQPSQKGITISEPTATEIKSPKSTGKDKAVAAQLFGPTLKKAQRKAKMARKPFNLLVLDELYNQTHEVEKANPLKLGLQEPNKAQTEKIPRP